MKKKTVALLMACMMALGVAVGGTMAWLTDKTVDVKNTFTVGDINIDLDEHVYDPAKKELTTGTTKKNENYLFVPGHTLPKDPFVTVEAKSEACLLFVKVVENNDSIAAGTTLNGKDISVSNIMTWEIDNTEGWKLVDGQSNVWYIEVDAATAETGKVFNVLKDKKVTFSGDVTKEMVTWINGGKDNDNADVAAHKPELVLTAYAAQLYKNNTDKFTPAEAWAILNPSQSGGSGSTT